MKNVSESEKVKTLISQLGVSCLAPLIDGDIVSRLDSLGQEIDANLLADILVSDRGGKCFF